MKTFEAEVKKRYLQRKKKLGIPNRQEKPNEEPIKKILKQPSIKSFLIKKLNPPYHVNKINQEKKRP